VVMMQGLPVPQRRGGPGLPEQLGDALLAAPQYHGDACDACDACAAARQAHADSATLRCMCIAPHGCAASINAVRI
jgi:hypothetical protein